MPDAKVGKDWKLPDDESTVAVLFDQFRLGIVDELETLVSCGFKIWKSVNLSSIRPALDVFHFDQSGCFTASTCGVGWKMVSAVLSGSIGGNIVCSGSRLGAAVDRRGISGVWLPSFCKKYKT